MNEIITIDRNAFGTTIPMEIVWQKPVLSKSTLFRLPWEVYQFADITIIRQHLKLIGTHLQVIEAKNEHEAILPLTASFRICTLFFVLQGGIKSFGTTQSENLILSPCFSMVYFPFGRTDLTLPPGLHNFLIVSLEFDWPLSFPNIIDTFRPLMQCWEINHPSVHILPFCNIPFKLKRILVKMKGVAILNYKDGFNILMDVSTCITLYHEQYTTTDLVTQREFIKIADRLLSYLKEHYMLEESCRLEIVAQQFGISTFILQRSCNVIHGTTFFQFLTRLRIEESCKLLENATMNINQIAVEVGYASLKSYHKSFKRIKGLSPSQYRKNSIGLTS
ncbi:MAG: AraC family transcriptional regulator [Sphingobacterium sp.]|jgi:AraC-like DNA-binding protein|nr:AraC family transcriptional regulator [Sphingobacterium sp.]